MTKRFTVLFLFASLLNVYIAIAGNLWHHIEQGQRPATIPTVHPLHYDVYTLDEATLKTQLRSLPADKNKTQIIDLPMPDGSMKTFTVWKTSIMPEQLAARYPELMTFTAEEAGNPNVTAKLDFTLSGFHAMIFDGGNISFIDPHDNTQSGYYITHYKRDEIRQHSEMTKCMVSAATPIRPHESILPEQRKVARTVNGYTLRTYRLALACDHYYAQTATGNTLPTIAQTLGVMLTSMNRINGVYERELSITMNFVDNEDTLIWTRVTDPKNGADPFNAFDNDASNCLLTNQAICDARIGNANYDIGHVFTTGAGGLSQVGVVCHLADKAQSVTGQSAPVGDGFDIDYVAHEMGHEFGAEHSFNSSEGNCGGDNLVDSSAYEPGSGSTIMAYAGICSPDDLQPHSDAYFHSISLEQIQDYITTDGDVCAVKNPTNNKLVSLSAFTASYSIPYLTPFELIAPTATDSVADTSITYCWEQWDRGDYGSTLLNTHTFGPIFRSFTPVKSPTRIFPKNSMVLTGALSDAGMENNEGEKAPDVARSLTFQLTLRDVFQGNGCFLIPDDKVHINAINTGAGFTVTSQNTAGLYYIGNSPETVTWNVVGTNVSPINASSVDIYMSIDGGNTWPYHVGNFPNSGSAIVNLPNPDTDTHAARIKVKGSGNIFFNVNRNDFTVTHSLASDTSIVIYPVPTHSILRMFGGTRGLLNGVIFNAVGQQAWKGQIDGETDISVALWARGIYFVKLVDVKGQLTIKKIVVE